MRKRKGLTLIEMLFVLGIFSIIAGAIFAALTAGKNSWDRADRLMRVQQETRKAMEYITKDLRQAGVSTITTPAMGATGTQITFQVYIDNMGTWSAPITYSLNGTQITRTIGGALFVVGNNISLFNITRPALANNPNQRRVDIDIQASHSNALNTITSSVLSSRIMVRN